MAWASERGWENSETRPACLLVRLRQRTYVLPWSLFLYAEGSETEVRIAFHTHVLAIVGSGLSSLLSELAEQTVTQLVEPDRTAKFTISGSSQLTSLSVSESK